jgi:hypothetical protein
MKIKIFSVKTGRQVFTRLGLSLILLAMLAATAYADNVLEVETERDMVIWADSDMAKLGQSMAIGDFNGDGKDDVAIGSPQQHSKDGMVNDVGFVSVLFGSTAIKDLDGKVTPDKTTPSMEGVRNIRHNGPCVCGTTLGSRRSEQ